jgi:hypothetical protein
MNCSNDLKKNQILGLDFKSFSQSQEQFFLTVGQNNFGNKVPHIKLSSVPGPVIQGNGRLSFEDNLT